MIQIRKSEEKAEEARKNQAKRAIEIAQKELTERAIEIAQKELAEKTFSTQINLAKRIAQSRVNETNEKAKYAEKAAQAQLHAAQIQSRKLYAAQTQSRQLQEAQTQQLLEERARQLRAAQTQQLLEARARSRIAQAQSEEAQKAQINFFQQLKENQRQRYLLYI
jgi:hypothetical protein